MSWQHGTWQRHLKSSMPKKLFPGPYISKQVSAECLRIVPDPSWAPTSVCLCVQRPNTGSSRATFGPRHRCCVGGRGDGTFSAARCELPWMGTAKGVEIPFAKCAWELLTRSWHHTLPELQTWKKEKKWWRPGGTCTTIYLPGTNRPVGHLAASMSRCLHRPPVSPTHPFPKDVYPQYPIQTCHPCVKPKATDPFALVAEAT